jgi:very-short-patch-repair endonuclease
MRDSQNIRLARRLRQRETNFESELWRELRARRAMGLKFRRQHPVGPYVVDFACLEARLLIEIDGYWHTFRKSEDAAREKVLRAAGFDIVRYDIENESADAHTIAEAIAHEARVRIERGF